MKDKKLSDQDFLYRYQQALKTQCKRTQSAFTEDALIQYLNGIDEYEVVNISSQGSGGHTMVVTKEKGLLYFYDPNATDMKYGRCEEMSAGKIAECIISYSQQGEKPGSINELNFFIFDHLKLNSDDYHYPTESISKFDDNIEVVAQDRISNIVALYFQKIYGDKVGPKGVCFALSILLRNLIAQTGSIKTARSILYKQLKELSELETNLQGLNEMSKTQLFKEIGHSGLILSLIPFLHSRQRHQYNQSYSAISYSGLYSMEGERMFHHSSQGMIRFLPLSIPMQAKNSRVSERDTAARFLTRLSNPTHTYSVLSNLNHVEYQNLENSIQSEHHMLHVSQVQGNGLSKDQVLARIQDSPWLITFLETNFIIDNIKQIMSSSYQYEFLFQNPAFVADLKQALISPAQNRQFVEQILNISDKGRTLLMYTALKGKVDFFQLLLENTNKERLFDVDVNGNNVLILAVYAGHLDVVALLLEHSPEQINYQDNEGTSALMVAATQGHYDIVELLLKHSPEQINYQDNEGANALMLAAYEGHDDIVALLLQYMTIDQIEYQNKNGASAFMAAATKGHYDIVELLLNSIVEAQANDNISNGYNTLIQKMQSSHFNLIENLTQHDTTFLEAVVKNQLRIVDLILRHSGAIKSPRFGDRPVLMLAISEGHLAMVRLLLEHNSGWRFETYKHGTTALMVAVTQGKLEMVKLLLEKDPVSQLEAMNVNAVNALNLALSHKHEDIANYIANKMHETNCMSVVDRGRLLRYGYLVQAYRISSTEVSSLWTNIKEVVLPTQEDLPSLTQHDGYKLGGKKMNSPVKKARPSPQKQNDSSPKKQIRP